MGAGTTTRSDGAVKTVRLTTAQAIVRFLAAQRTELDGQEAPLVPGVFAIFGHGNVTGLGFALDELRDELPTIRGQNEQGMALAAVGYAKAMRRRQLMAVTSSIGPGALNIVTAAGVAMANRLPLLILSGDTFQSRIPDPVLQQVEHFGAPSTTVNDAFRAVTRYWDRITHPAQVAQSLPAAIETMLDPADCGPAFIGLPQDVQAAAYDFPARLFERRLHALRRQRPDENELDAAAAALRAASRPLVVAGGGVHYSLAEDTLRSFVETHRIPVVETVAGKSCLAAEHALLVAPIGVTGADHANRLAAEADVVLCVGTRLQDFTTGSWTVFGDESMTLIGVNAARFDAAKHRALPVVGDARVGLEELGSRLDEWHADGAWVARAAAERESFAAFVAENSGGRDEPPTYAQVIGAVNRSAREQDYALTAAGGFPGELNVNWLAKGVGTFDCEYGFSCMGYEIAGGWGARLARRDGEVFCFAGDGSYLMLNSELYSSVLTGQKLIVVVCDNGGYAVIERLQTNMGGRSFNNMFGEDRVRVDWAAHAAALGCRSERVAGIDDLEEAIERARAADRTTVIAVETAPDRWTPGGAFWEVGVAEVSDRHEIEAAFEEVRAAKERQRIGW
jgi:3D-(3,5/4)-trihydroxycyclohexane-1,2-dione acylhydrolase (decyclizing)